MIIYKAENKTNGKIYIGRTEKLLLERKKRHQQDFRNRPFPNAIRKYGIDGFIWEILFEGDNKNQLARAERFFIGYYREYLGYDSYNLHEGGNGGDTGNYDNHKLLRGEEHYNFGKKHTKVTREKWSQQRKGERNGMFGKKHSDRTKEKIRQKRIDKTLYNFYHPEYGFRICTKFDLRKKFDLDISQLTKMCNRQDGYKTCKGWITIII